MIWQTTIQHRLAQQPSMYEQLEYIGCCVDAEAALGVTAFCWVNGFDMANVAFDVQQDYMQYQDSE